MAPSSGHLLVPKALKAVQFAIHKTANLISSKFPANNAATTATTSATAQPAYAYARATQPLHPLAFLKQARSQAARNNTRWFSTQPYRSFVSRSGIKQTSRPLRSQLPKSRTSTTLHKRGLTPFASTLRPNLTGGALPRTAGGYTLGGGSARQFSHTAGCNASVVQNVSAGIRAFCVNGGRVRYDGIDNISGEKIFRRVSKTEQSAYKGLEKSNMMALKGTTLEFKIAPTVTAFMPGFSQGAMEEVEPMTLNKPGMLDVLSGDFARALKDLASILGDLNRLASFGDLPISMNNTSEGPVLRVRFPGCDADLVSRLCDEVAVTRGVVVEDEAWHDDKEVQMALLFPFPPAGAEEDDILSEGYFAKRNNDILVFDQARHERMQWQDMLPPSTTSSAKSLRSAHYYEAGFDEGTLRSPTQHTVSPSGYESLEDPYDWTSAPPSHSPYSGSKMSAGGSQDYEGVEGIYKFLQVCDEARR